MKRTLAIEYTTDGNDQVIVEDVPWEWVFLEAALCRLHRVVPFGWWGHGSCLWASQEAFRRTVEIIRFPVDCGSCVAEKLWPTEDVFVCEDHPKEES